MLFSSDRDDSFIKLHEVSSVLFAARLRIVHMLVCLTLTLTSESVYGSQFFHCKLLQVLMS